MNAREAMQALLDGKTVITNFGEYRLSDDGEVVLRSCPEDVWIHCGTFINHVSEIVEEYPLTFKEAVMAMLDGKIVVSEVDSDTQNKFDCDRFYAKPKFTDWVEAVGFAPGETKCKWKVVEE